MVQQLRRRERDTLRVEQPTPHRPSIIFELDRENQGDDANLADREMRERVIAYRVLEAKFNATHPKKQQP